MKGKSLLGGILSLILVLGIVGSCSSDNAVDEGSSTSSSSISTSDKGTNLTSEEISQLLDEYNNSNNSSDASSSSKQENSEGTLVDLTNIPKYEGIPYTVVNNNVPYFTASELSTKSFEEYSSLDSLGRCGVAMACVGKDIMPTEERGSIGSVKPTGWHTVRYSNVDGKYLYNRCHLIGYQLTGENANPKNLITGTRYLNVDGMLRFENWVADYVKSTGNHVMYRVTPVFEGSNLLASGVLMEAYSVEDSGGLRFCMYVYNVQPGIGINYADGSSNAPTLISSSAQSSGSTNSTQSNIQVSNSSQSNKQVDFVLNTNSKKYHKPSCSTIKTMSDANKESYNGTREWLINNGYDACKRCNP